MDYRERKYYLVAFIDHNQSIINLKEKIHSIKIHPPYNHFRNNESINTLKFIRERMGYNWEFNHVHDNYAGYGYIENLISCRKEECDLLEEICKYNCNWLQEVTKRELKQ